MRIKECTKADIDLLAQFNKRLIEDEKSNNPMNLEQLKGRMAGFIKKEYHAYLFYVEQEVVGYALVRHSVSPIYIRQFYIDRPFRKKHYGTEAFQRLLEHLKAECVDVEVLSWNEAGKRFWENVGFYEVSKYMRYEK